MKIHEITETRTDEAVPIVGGITVGAAILYVLSALSAGVTIWEFCNEAEVQGSWDPREWDEDAQKSLFGDVVLSAGLGAAGKVIGWGWKSLKGFKGATKAMDAKDLAKKTQKIEPTIAPKPTKADDLAKDIYGRTEPKIDLPKVEKPRYRSNPDGSLTRIK